jgi:hypothetical protein
MAVRKKSAEGGAKRGPRPSTAKQRDHLAKARAARGPDRMGGRHSGFKAEYAHVARLMCENGARDADLADAFNVSVMTIGRWQSKHEEFAAALKIAKGEFDDRVERALAQRAIGYSFDTEKIFMVGTEVVRVPFREHIPPDPIAAFKWLSCRRMNEWRDRKELTGPDGGPIVSMLNEINGGSTQLVDARTFNVHDVRTNGNRGSS